MKEAPGHPARVLVANTQIFPADKLINTPHSHRTVYIAGRTDVEVMFRKGSNQTCLWQKKVHQRCLHRVNPLNMEGD